MALDIEWNRERLTLLPERALWRPECSSLYIADTHFGKDAAFRQKGIAIPAAAGHSDLDRLTTLLEKTQARRLVVLGDLFHARSGLTPATRDALSAWRERCPSLNILLIRGNHDRAAGDPLPEWNIDCVSEPFVDGALRLFHIPPTESDGEAAALAGHLHPSVTLTGSGNTRLTLPCFWVRPHVIVLPAFTDFAGRPLISPTAGDRIFVCGEDIAEVPLHISPAYAPRRY